MSIYIIWFTNQCMFMHLQPLYCMVIWLTHWYWWVKTLSHVSITVIHSISVKSLKFFDYDWFMFGGPWRLHFSRVNLLAHGPFWDFWTFVRTTYRPYRDGRKSRISACGHHRRLFYSSKWAEQWCFYMPLIHYWALSAVYFVIFTKMSLKHVRKDSFQFSTLV